MTITELQDILQEMYEKYGDVEVVNESVDYTETVRYQYGICKVEKTNSNGKTMIALVNK